MKKHMKLMSILLLNFALLISANRSLISKITAGDLEIKVFDINGKQITSLFSGDQEAGSYELTWDASEMPSDVYIVRMVAEDPETSSRQVFSASLKLILLK